MEKFYITTPIYYVNDKPHAGHAFTSVLADVMARYHRLVGNEVFFLTGTDEHGAKVSRAAEEKNVDVKKFVDDNALEFQNLTHVLNLSNDDFIRTSDKKRHWPGAEKMWQTLCDNGDIYKSKYKGLYCVGCEAFVTEKDLKDGKCIYHEKEPEVIEEENYFFKLSKYADKLKELIEKGDIKIMPETRKNETLSFIKAGLDDVSFSRPAKDLNWGIPVPGDSSQTIYVWCDALTNYLSALGYGRDEKLLKKFWPAGLHVLAKDIMRFHTIFWPAMLLSAGLPLPKKFLIHGFINSDGKKMSKTLGNVINPNEFIDDYGVDAFRYYLIRELSSFEDGDFTEEKFKEAYNANLANGLGNYVSRVFKMSLSYFNGLVNRPDEVLLSQVPLKQGEREEFSVPYVFEHRFWPEYKKQMEGLRINSAADVCWKAISALDTYVQDYQPFKLINTDKEKTMAVMWSLLYGLADITLMIEPFLPGTANKILENLGVEKDDKIRDSFLVKEIGILFPRKD